MTGLDQQGSAGVARHASRRLRVVGGDAGDPLARLSRRLDVEVESMVETFFVEARRVALLPELSPELATALKVALEVGVRDAVRRLCERAPHPRRLPRKMDEVARLWARDGCDLSRLIDCVDLARDVVRPSFERFAEEVVPDAESRWTLMSRAQRGLAGWTRAVNELLRRSYDAECRVARRRISSERARRVARILAGDSSAAVELGYELSLEHLAVIAWGDDATGTIHALARRCCRELVAVEGPSDCVWGWLGGNHGLAATEVAELVAWQRQRSGCVVFGEPASGVEGFRVSHEQAREAREFALLLGESAVCYGEIALLALVAREPKRAMAFAGRELEGVDDVSARSGELRETLAAYLRHGQSIKAAALERGIHRQTMRQHIRAIEERLRYPIADRSAELILALRLRQLSEADGTAR